MTANSLTSNWTIPAINSTTDDIQVGFINPPTDVASITLSNDGSLAIICEANNPSTTDTFNPAISNFITVSINKTTGNVSFYINGTLITTTGDPTTITSTLNCRLYAIFVGNTPTTITNISGYLS